MLTQGVLPRRACADARVAQHKSPNAALGAHFWLQDEAEASAGADDSSSVHEQRSPEDYLIECVALCTSDSEGERDADTTVRSSLSETLPAQLVGPASDVGDAGQSGAQQGESQADEAAAASDAAADVSEHPVEQPAADPAAAQAPAAAVTRPAAAATAAAAVETGPLSELIQSCEEMSAMVADEEQILQSITFLTPVQPQARRGAPAKKKADGTGPVTGELRFDGICSVCGPQCLVHGSEHEIQGGCQGSY